MKWAATWTRGSPGAVAVRTWCVLVALVGLAGMALGRGPGIGLFTALAALVWGLGWLAVAWALVPDPAVRTVWGLALCAGTLLVASSLAWPGWLSASLASRSGALALVTVLPLLWISYPSRPSFLVRVTCFPVLVGFGLAAGLAQRLPEVLDVATLVLSVVLVAAFWWRLERGPVEERDTVLWLVCALGLTLLVLLPLTFVGGGPVSAVLVSLLLLVLCAATVLGLHPPGQVDIRLLILRLSVYAVTMLLMLGVFSGAAGVLQLVTDAPPSLGVLSLVALGLGMAFSPVRRLLDGVLGRLLFGDRVDPLTAASRFGEELSSAPDPLLALRALRQVLGLPYAALVDTGTADVVSGTEPAEGTYRLPLQVGDATVGALVLGVRPGERGAVTQDRDLLRFVVATLAQPCTPARWRPSSPARGGGWSVRSRTSADGSDTTCTMAWDLP